MGNNYRHPSLPKPYGQKTYINTSPLGEEGEYLKRYT